MIIEEDPESTHPVNFMNAENAFMYDRHGNVMYCKCGKSASGGLVGRDSSKIWCEDCSPYKDAWVADFVYRPPKEI